MFVFANTFTLAVKTKAFAWNATGLFSASLRTMFKEQFNDHWPTIDEIAMRILVLGLPAPSAFGQFAPLSDVPEEPDVPEWRDMVRQLILDQEVVARTCQRAHATAELFNDTATLDLMGRRVARHQRNAWELKALLE